ncbi:folylpolyglutamate synthase/dihydrofolate synthase family protein [Candidatus Merdisoma sp. JLR.KK006]|uniref:bifunctional folylpolyglutamate synthase/dihydrofolate synthase n=1 Tax=Candidatus Merdisoma sp. JLR.KK006 TaxID=3112626 RepID=UPI002FF3B5BF
MTYKEARAFIDDTSKYGYILGLDTITELLNRLGNPQDDLKFVHIAGTNGKGSILAYVSTILKEAGYRVGRYISPTIFEYRERIQVNEEYISEEAVARLAQRIYEKGQEMLAEGLAHPTAFEVETAMAFLYFQEMNCDIVVLETGMGGLTDATNVVKTTLISAFASISMDHMGFLGNTLEEIAKIKAGIIKPNTMVVSTAQNPEVRKVLEATCRQQRASYHEIREEEITDRQVSFEEQSFTYKGWKKLRPGILGSCQLENAAAAAEVIYELRDLGYPVSEEAIRQGLEKTRWIGRFTIVDEDPLFIVDGAHNRDAADRLLETLKLYVPHKRKVFIIGVLADKEYDYIMSRLVPEAERIVTVMTPNNPRALPAKKLAETVKQYNSEVEAAQSIREAVQLAKGYADKDGMILAFGSLSYLGDLIEEVRKGKET